MKLILDACNNHIGNMDIIEEMIISAATIGAHAIKFQLFNYEELNPAYPDYEKMSTTYAKYQLDADKIKRILQLCALNNIKPGFTIFSESRIQLLKDALDGFTIEPLIKIASPDFMNNELIALVYNTFGYVEDFIISTGMDKEPRVTEQRVHLNNLFRDFKYLYCVSRYPCPIEYILYSEMVLFDGFSDHTEGLEASKKAIELNMEFIERHYTLSRTLPGKDQKVSITTKEAEELINYNKYINSIPNYKRRWRNG